MIPKRLARLACAIALVAASASAQTASDIAFDERLKRLEGELRCLVCQNQTLADSNAPLAEDLRREVRSLASSGKSDAEIRAFLVERYGDFVLYNPPVRESTWLLWFGPFALLAAGVLVWLAIVRRLRGAAAADEVGAPAVPASATDRAKAMLDDDAPRD